MPICFVIQSYGSMEPITDRDDNYEDRDMKQLLRILAEFPKE